VAAGTATAVPGVELAGAPGVSVWASKGDCEVGLLVAFAEPATFVSVIFTSISSPASLVWTV